MISLLFNLCHSIIPTSPDKTLCRTSLWICLMIFSLFLYTHSLLTRCKWIYYLIVTSLTLLQTFSSLCLLFHVSVYEHSNIIYCIVLTVINVLKKVSERFCCKIESDFSVFCFVHSISLLLLYFVISLFFYQLLFLSFTIVFCPSLFYSKHFLFFPYFHFSLFHIFNFLFLAIVISLLFALVLCPSLFTVTISLYFL